MGCWTRRFAGNRGKIPGHVSRCSRSTSPAAAVAWFAAAAQTTALSYPCPVLDEGSVSPGLEYVLLVKLKRSRILSTVSVDLQRQYYIDWRNRSSL